MSFNEDKLSDENLLLRFKIGAVSHALFFISIMSFWGLLPEGQALATSIFLMFLLNIFFWIDFLIANQTFNLHSAAMRNLSASFDFTHDVVRGDSASADRSLDKADMLMVEAERLMKQGGGFKASGFRHWAISIVIQVIFIFVAGYLGSNATSFFRSVAVGIPQLI